MVAENNEWTAECVITRRCETRHPALQPVHIWLGVVPPKTKLRAAFSIKNDTYQRVSFIKYLNIFKSIIYSINYLVMPIMT